MFNHWGKTAVECNGSMPGDNSVRCGTTIWSPSMNGHFVEDRVFSLYAMECEENEEDDDEV